MKAAVVIFVLCAVVMWAAFGAMLLGFFPQGWMIPGFETLTPPSTTAELGDSFSVFGALFSSLALVMGLLAIIIQARQQADSNVIGALSARHQYLLADCERLEDRIQDIKKTAYDQGLFKNMVAKQKRLREECENIDKRLAELLKKI